MPLGTSRTDEARFQRRLWSPALGHIKPFAWLDASDVSRLTIASSKVSAVAAGSVAKNGMTDSGTTGNVSFSPTGWVDGKSPCLTYNTVNLSGGLSMSNYTYNGTNGFTLICCANKAGSGFPAGYWVVLGANAAGGMMIRYRDDQVVDIVRSQQAAIIAGSASSALAGPHVVSCDSSDALSRVFVDGWLTGSTTTAPAYTQPSSGVMWSPVAADALGQPDRVAEWFFFDQTLPDWYRQKIEGYLAHKWGVVSTLRGDHPHASSPPLIGA
jgi:hypothetical protein